MKMFYLVVVCILGFSSATQAQSSTKENFKSAGKSIGKTGATFGKSVGKAGKEAGHSLKKPAGEVADNTKKTVKKLAK